MFLDDSEEQVTKLKNVLLAFELVSGLKVNYKKSALVAVGNSLHADSSALIFGCSRDQFPLNYLGIPLGTKSKSVTIWEVILQNFRRGLALDRGGIFLRAVG